MSLSDAKKLSLQDQFCNSCFWARLQFTGEAPQGKDLHELTGAMIGIFERLERREPVPAMEALKALFICDHIAALPAEEVKGLNVGPVLCAAELQALYGDLKDAGFEEAIGAPDNETHSWADNEEMARHFIGVAMANLKQGQPPGEKFTNEMAKSLCLAHYDEPHNEPNQDTTRLGVIEF